MRHPALPLFLALLAGAGAGFVMDVPRDLLGAVAVLGWVAAAISYAHRHTPGCVGATVATAALCGAALSAHALHSAQRPVLRDTLLRTGGTGAVSDAPGDPRYLHVALTSDASSDADGIRVEGDVRLIEHGGAAVRTRGEVVLSSPLDPDEAVERAWRKGRTVRLPALLRRPSRFLDPGVPDHEVALLRRGVAMVGLVKSARLVEVVAMGDPADEAAGAVRAFTRRAIGRYVGCHSPQSAAIASAIVIGDRSALDDDVAERLQAAGTYHVLAISGGNIAILTAVVLGVFRLAAVRSPVSECGASTVLVAYAWVVGGGASVGRATVMAVVMLVARAIDHRSAPANALAVAGLLTLAARPLVPYEPGAWLTYGATAAIVVAAARIGTWLSARRWWWRAPLALLVASAAAEVALMPIGAYVFSRVTMAGLLVNFAAIPCMTVVQVAAMGTVAVAAISDQAAAWTGYVTHLAAVGLVDSGKLVELVPWLARRVPPPAMGWLWAYYAAITVALLTANRGRRWRLVSASGVVAAVTVAWVIVAAPVFPGVRPDRGVRVTFIDVGQGDSALVQTAGGFSILVDAGGAGGGRFDIGGRVVAPVLWAQGVRRLDALVVTHGDLDHLAGAVAVIRDFRPREIWEGVPVTAHAPLVELRAAADAAGASWRTLQRGDTVVRDGVTLTALHPPLADWERLRVRNDDSVVLEVRCGEVSFVLPGDIEASAEATVSEALGTTRLRVLEAPHHGSATSSGAALIGGAAPRVGIVSAGRGNRYGHPHAAVLQRLQAAGADIFRTDRDGAIVAGTDGRTLRIETFRGDRRVYLAGPPGRVH